jgi:hypothetical protein
MATTKSLEINFHGPIVFRFCKDVAWAYLPICDEHFCNILTDTNDLSAKRHKIIEIKGPTSAATPPHPVGGAPLVTPLVWNKKWKEEPNPRKCYCTFKLPLPDLIFGLRPEQVKISGDEVNVNGEFARGLRFVYNECLAAPTIGPASPSAVVGAPSSIFDPACFNNGNLYQMEIRYHDSRHNRANSRHHHQDAEKCSLAMRKLLPPCDKWKVSFDPPKVSKKLKNKIKDNPWLLVISGKHPVDCGANPLVFFDNAVPKPAP